MSVDVSRLPAATLGADGRRFDPGRPDHVFKELAKPALWSLLIGALTVHPLLRLLFQASLSGAA
jgi:hypothetical protein